ncbi:MAG: P1 family peptidase [Anaerolineae bacterium]|nr:P1 family peptidase [Anaerolineae bacterium]
MTRHRCRAREVGIETGLLSPGPLNAITDVAGVRVGHVTLIEGDSVRTGVTAVLPHDGNLFQEKVIAAVHTLNGYGKAMGFEQVREVGTLETPLLLCSTLDVGRVADAVVRWMLEQNPALGRQAGTVSPLVAECFDGYLNDARTPTVQWEQVWAAIENAQAGPVAEGNVGAGTGMSGFEFKGGIGTSSRRLDEEHGGFSVGALVCLNCGRRQQLLIQGVPVGRALADWPGDPTPDGGSIIMVLATDAPLEARQLGRLARRAPLGLARTGAVASHRSGDFVIAFSTAQRIPTIPVGVQGLAPRVQGLAPRAQGPAPLLTHTLTVLAEDCEALNWLFQAAIEATEEAIINALCMAETMLGREGHVRYALPLDRVVELLQMHGRIGARPTSGR